MNLNDDKLNELSKLLKDSIKVYEDDRAMAVQNYQDMKSQLENILEGGGGSDEDGDSGFEMSQDCKLEAEVNKALKLVFEASRKLDKVIFHVTNVIIAQLNNESREKIADKFQQGSSNLIPNRPVDFKQLQNRGKQALEFDDEDERD